MRSEFEFIKSLQNKAKGSKSIVGIGDDCAVFPKNSTHDLVITTDMLVEDIDFRRNWMIPKFLGHKALAVSLSDIAAMGACSTFSMLSIGIPHALWESDFVEEFYEGYLRLAKKFEVELIGGDVSKTPDKIVIDSVAIGEVEKGKAILRSGAKVGDAIYVTGELGGACAGLKLLESGILYNDSTKIWQKDLILKQLSPFPNVVDGKAVSRFATSMIDISDGLLSDLYHICEASGVGARLYAKKIPIHRKIEGLTKDFDEQLDFALNGGEDFELLFTVDPFLPPSITNATCIGEITGDKNVIEMVRSGEVSQPEIKGFRHF